MGAGGGGELSRHGGSVARRETGCCRAVGGGGVKDQLVSQKVFCFFFFVAAGDGCDAMVSGQAGDGSLFRWEPMQATRAPCTGGEWRLSTGAAAACLGGNDLPRDAAGCRRTPT